MSTPSNVKGHGVLHQYSTGPVFSSNFRFKKHIVPLEIVSEATADETDDESTLNGTTSSLGTSPTGETASSAATEISSTRMHKQLQFSTMTEAAPSSANQKERDFVKLAYKAHETSSSTAYKKPRSEVDVQPSESALNLHRPGISQRCFPSLSSRTADLLQKSSNSLCKLQGFICRLWQRSLESEDDEDLIQARLPDTNMDDVNEMKALLNTINNNLKMLETRSRAHPQLLSSKLAPVYFTT